MSYTLKTTLTATTPTANAEFATSVALDGYYAVVGCPYETNGGFAQAGVIYIYKRDINNNWNLQQRIGASTPAANAYFGYSVDIYRNSIVVGAYGASTKQGQIFLLKRTENNWEQKSSSTETSAAANYEFGKSVSISKDYIVSGSPKHGSGYVEIFKIVNDILVSKEILYISNGQSGDNFGCSVSLDNSYVLIGTEGEDSNAGCAYIYKQNTHIETLWEQQSRIVSADILPSDKFGCAVSISGDFLIIGAKNKLSDSNEPYAGAAYIFNKTSNELWYEIKKLSPSTGETNYETNYFGTSVNIKGDYAIVGSPGARNDRGLADVYYRKNSWDNTQKLLASDGVAGDYFGYSVGIYDLFLIIGAPKNDYSATIDAGYMYVFENPVSNLRLAQQFYISSDANPSNISDDLYVPTKGSIYLKKIGGQSINYIQISNEEVVIDATNFSTIEQQDNKVIFDDRIGNFTGNGYMILAPEPQLTIDNTNSEDFSIINYPIRALSSDTFYLWIRCLSSSDNPSSDLFKADLLLDGIIIYSFEEMISPNEWNWIYKKIVIPDTQIHTLGIRIKEKNCAIDKLYFDTNYYEPDVIGPPYTESSYITTHMKVYESDQSIYPSYPLFIYDYKTSIDEIVQDDWYNFNIKILDTRMGYNKSSYFDSNYFLVLAVSGMNDKNFVIWQQVDNDEYNDLPSMIKV